MNAGKAATAAGFPAIEKSLETALDELDNRLQADLASLEKSPMPQPAKAVYAARLIEQVEKARASNKKALAEVRRAGKSK